MLLWTIYLISVFVYNTNITTFSPYNFTLISHQYDNLNEGFTLQSEDCRLSSNNILWNPPIFSRSDNCADKIVTDEWNKRTIKY